MLTEFRAMVHDVIQDASTSWPVAIDVWDVIPDDINAVPCIVVTRPSATESNEARTVFDLSIDLYVIGRRQQAGDHEKELTVLTDAIWETFNGTHGIIHRPPSPAGLTRWPLHVTEIAPRTIAVAGNDCPGFVMTVTSAEATC